MKQRVLIVGSGLAGASVAWHLAPHADVQVLDQAEQPGAEASSQNAGMVRRLGEDPYERALSLRTAAWLDDPGEDWPHSPSRVVGAVIGLAIDPWWLSDAVAHIRAAGVRVDDLPSPSDVAPALANAEIHKAWHVPDERVADAHALVQGFVRGARRNGATFTMRTPITELLVEAGRVIGVRTPNQVIHADAVVLATGAWSQQLAARHGLHRPLAPLRRTLLQSEPHALSHPDHPWVWIDDVGVYARPEAGGWLCSGCDEAVDPPVGVTSRGPVEPEPRALLATKLETLLPALADVRVRNGWTGLRTFAPDRRPVLGADTDLEGLWWAAGLGGFGVSTCKGVGEAVSAWLMGESLDWIQARGVSPGRPFPRRWAIRPLGDIHRSVLVDG